MPRVERVWWIACTAREQGGKITQRLRQKRTHRTRRGLGGMRDAGCGMQVARSHPLALVSRFHASTPAAAGAGVVNGGGGEGGIQSLSFVVNSSGLALWPFYWLGSQCSVLVLLLTLTIASPRHPTTPWLTSTELLTSLPLCQDPPLKRADGPA